MTINYDAGKTTVTDFVTITYVLVEIYNPGFIRDWPITLVCHAPHGAVKWLPMMLRHVN